MNKPLLFALGAAALVAMQADAQKLKTGYVKFSSSTKLQDYLSQWSGTNRAITVEGEAGEANVTFASAGEHNVTLTLENSYGSSVAQYPVFKVLDPLAIDGVETDGGELRTYTVDRLLFLEFAEAGSYNVQVYNTAGMLMANSRLHAGAGETARVQLGTPGIYMVKVMKDGTELRTIKIAVK